MAQEIRAWLQKMQYPGPEPSDETLQTLCRGAMGPIFQQLIDKVKPRQEVDKVKKIILLNRLSKTKASKSIESFVEIKELKMYEEKCRLEKQLCQLKSEAEEAEINFQCLKRNVEIDYVEIKRLKHRIDMDQKDCILYNAKSAELDKQIQECKELLGFTKLLNEHGNIKGNEDAADEKIKRILPTICDAIVENDQQLTQSIQDESPESTQLSAIVNSFRKPLSTIKKRPKPNSTYHSQISLKFSTATKLRRNNSKTSLFSGSVIVNQSDDKHMSIMRSIEGMCWKNEVLRRQVEEIWLSGCGNVLKRLMQLKKDRKEIILKLIADNRNKTTLLDWGLEKLYTFHIQKEMELVQLKQKHQKLLKMLNNKLDDVPKITLLEATECGLESSIEHLRKQIRTFEEFSENSEDLENMLAEKKAIQNETASIKSKLETNLRLLYDCNSWLSKSQLITCDSIKEPQFHSEYNLLQTNVAEVDVHNFVSCPIQQRNQSYLDSWNQICEKPELLELFKHPYLQPDKVIKGFLDDRKWLSQLKMFQCEITKSNISEISMSFDEFPEESDENCFQNCLTKLNQCIMKNNEIAGKIKDSEKEIDLWMESNLNYYVAPNIKYENKSLKDYVEAYESVYKQLNVSTN